MERSLGEQFQMGQAGQVRPGALVPSKTSPQSLHDTVESINLLPVESMIVSRRILAGSAIPSQFAALGKFKQPRDRTFRRHHRRDCHLRSLFHCCRPLCQCGRRVNSGKAAVLHGGDEVFIRITV
jgi:hypothetical protein